ncbi:protein PIH1D3 [Scaptodrosophila lebanonensis]|uniref:Protein PIH1D3 n=1 Tax=Drosophila lebanonensis TaxID=7225 RepID=A0A6J2UC95_DROLE|nr:protein PIH1D3 [Scaptodrosophila lebanonensis]
MSMFDNPDQIRELANLLSPNPRRGGIDYSSSDDEDSVVPRLTPGGIGPGGSAAGAGKKKKVNPVATPLVETPKEQPKTLEEWQEQQEREDADVLEERLCPEYTMTYRQAVGTEDVYLQMGNRTGASASCEDLVVEITLPDEPMRVDQMELKMKESELDLATSKYRLRLPLPHPVDTDRSKAKYDSELKKLQVTLRLRRELDFVNF